MKRKVSEAGSESLANELAGLRGLDGKTLKERWRALYGSEPPASNLRPVGGAGGIRTLIYGPSPGRKPLDRLR
jgi:hypothetical protein